jgi:hypothetical protein
LDRRHRSMRAGNDSHRYLGPARWPDDRRKCFYRLSSDRDCPVGIGQKIIPSNTLMRFRKLRIAWSVVWGLAAVLPIVLLVRSYWILNSLDVSGGHRFTSSRGCLFIDEKFFVAGTSPKGSQHKLLGHSVLHVVVSGGMVKPNGVGTKLPLWPLVTIVAVLPIAPWILVIPWLRWRFSLRTLLIATTLVAVVLGLIIAVLRWPAG